MKKTLARITAAALGCMMLASCGAQNSANSGKVELSVGNWPSTEGKDLDTKNALKDAFEKEYPNIAIVPDTWSFDLQTFYPKAEAGLLPNYYTAHFSEMPKLIDGEYVYDITKALDDNGYSGMNENIKKVVSKDDAIYALPTLVYTLGIVYNTDMFEAAGLVDEDGTPHQPKDWNEMAEMAVKIKEVTGKPGMAITTSNNTGGWIFTNMAWSYGVDFMEQDADGKWKATFNTPEMEEALQFISDLKWKYDVLPANVLVDQDELRKTFATGGAGMIISAPDAAALSKFDMDPKMFGMMAIPSGPKRRVSLMGGTLNCVSNTSSPEQADAFVKWMDFGGSGLRFDDTVKSNMESTYQTNAENGQAIGAKSFRIWGDDSDKVKYEDELIDKYYNMKPNAAKLYNESFSDPSIELQAEEPVCAQDLYSILDTCIQQVLDNKDADIKTIIEKANTDFQTNYLDNIDY